MLFGYLIARALLVLAHLFGRLPARYIKAFARLLDAVSGPFHVVNYYGSCAGARIIGHRQWAGSSTGSSPRCTAASPPSLPGTWGSACTTRPAGIPSSRTS